MELGRRLLSTPSPPSQPRNLLRNHTSTSGTKISQVSSRAAPRAVGDFPRSVITQELRETYKELDEFKLPTANEKKLEKIRPLSEAKEDRYKQNLKDVESKVLYWLQPREFALTHGKAVQSIEKDELTTSISSNFSEKGAAALSGDKINVESYKIKFSTEVPVVRSNRLIERRLKNRKATKILKYVKRDGEVSNSSIRCCKLSKKVERCIDSNDPLRFFDWGFEYRKFLSREEEKEVIINIQDVIRLEEAKERFKSHFNREPTPMEWARTVGLSSQAFDSYLVLGKCSLEKIVTTNFRFVLHIAKQYQGNGIAIEDLVQEGYKGLLKSLRKFEISKGNRFKTYARWWIRQSIRKAIQENSRTIRLPPKVFDLLRRIKREKKLCVQEGYAPKLEEIARRIGIRTEKLRRLLWYGREPVSLNDRIFTWYCEDLTYEEITADQRIEQPDIAVFKMLMREHVRQCLNILTPRERTVIEHRFGIIDRERKTLNEIGGMFGLTRERIRQIESCALQKLREIASREDLSAYAMFLN
ncbi:RNA polymerase sigma factor [Rhynchospora pubera]|uniref:RNA polymerase sigma factor n=1 Tax=Rhynchospora pubera TaxID=906938 RepID=A0AAV8EIA7_9POAL|nr:RNA polymerase sigma factor [Rhynchospora pubera]